MSKGFYFFLSLFSFFSSLTGFFFLFFKGNWAMQNSGASMKVTSGWQGRRALQELQCFLLAQKPQSLMLWLGDVAFIGYKSSF